MLASENTPRPPEENDFYVDLVRVIGNGVVLSTVEHPKYWTADKYSQGRL